MDDYCQTLLEVWLQAALPLQENAEWKLVTDLSVDARQLHMVLGIRKTYNAWVKDHLRRQPWSEGTDYITHNPDNNRINSKYYLEINMARDIALMTGSALGYAVCRYLVQAEKTYPWQAELDYIDNHSYQSTQMGQNHHLSRNLYYMSQHMLDRLTADIDEAAKSSKKYPQELAAYIRESLLVHYDVYDLCYLRPYFDLHEATCLVDLCAQAFMKVEYEPSWQDDGFITFYTHCADGTLGLSHPRMW